jgi:lysozyme
MIHERGIALIKFFEGCAKRISGGRVTAYLCPAKVWTIGWGTTGSTIKPGLTISQEAADLLLDRDVGRFAQGVLRQSPSLILFPLRLAAVTSFAYNLGVGAYQASTMRRLINAGRWEAAAAQFPRWVMAGGRELLGLVRRRAAERALFASENPQ